VCATCIAVPFPYFYAFCSILKYRSYLDLDVP